MDFDWIGRLAAASGPYVAYSLIVALGVLIGRSAPSVGHDYQNLWMIIATVAIIVGLVQIFVVGIVQFYGRSKKSPPNVNLILA